MLYSNIRGSKKKSWKIFQGVLENSWIFWPVKELEPWAIVCLDQDMIMVSNFLCWLFTKVG